MFRSYSFFIHASSLGDDGTESPGMTPQVQFGMMQREASKTVRERPFINTDAEGREVHHTEGTPSGC